MERASYMIRMLRDSVCFGSSCPSRVPEQAKGTRERRAYNRGHHATRVRLGVRGACDGVRTTMYCEL